MEFDSKYQFIQINQLLTAIKQDKTPHKDIKIVLNRSKEQIPRRTKLA